MMSWADELHDILLQVSGVMNRSDVDARFLTRAGVKLDRALFPLLTRIGSAGPLGAVELAGLVGRDHSTVSRQVSRLEELGLIQRTPSPADGRIRLLSPTASGKQMLAEFARTRRRLTEEYFADWSDHEQAELLRLLRKMATGIDRAAGPDGSGA
ncbi:MAG: MarR family transcriptional regulator [Phenylobacterium sp.]|uniref:MarR family winged helix-turn-helix transcriptional regulator n=1 Tax=Phenylobacterium sp. TaxID=1871053 RepID=UPI00121FAAD6|nr:MarR family transcriptional regulator [Phenylobacterium sp.]TAL34301.1 MAG: MarR family transcriptional regulator [Phenylobacterium sp.]